MRQAWAALAEHLEARKRELVEAVRSYPTPIARCDEQLPEAIARRDAAARDLAQALEIDVAALSEAQWRERARALAARFAAAEDARLRAAGSRVLAELEGR
jgi:hypothetical protein